MPACVNCGTVQSKLNKGKVCKKCLNSDEQMDIPIITENILNIDKDCKDSLLANLYSTIEFLKNELLEKNVFIKSLLTLQNNILQCQINNKMNIGNNIQSSSPELIPNADKSGNTTTNSELEFSYLLPDDNGNDVDWKQRQFI